MNEIEEDTKKWEDIDAHGSEKSILLRCILLKSIYRFNAIPIKISMTFLTEPKKTTLKLIWHYKNPE